ncbi:MAG: GntR family transcriptional regulator [Thermotaleaceae bacterium]
MKASYKTIKKEIERMIESNILSVGSKLPSEYEMANYFNVSRETFRSAVKLLEQEGKVLVKHGVGTFVIKPLPNIPSSLEKLQSIGSMIKLAGLVEGERQESIRVMNCKEEWAEVLGINKREKVIVLERTRTANGEAVAYSINILPRSIVGDAFEAQEFSGSLLAFLEETCKIYIDKADTELKVPSKSEINQKIPQALELVPVILLKQIHYDMSNKTIFYSLDYLRNDIFSFWIRRERNNRL